MVQINSPSDAWMNPGKTWPRPAGARDVREFRVFRWNHDDGGDPRIDTYYVDRERCGPKVLDALIWIKTMIDPTLTFLHSCREGICASCAMNIDGMDMLACRRGMDENEGVVSIFPLSHRRVARDLMPDLSHYYAADDPC
jgi:succinate dehydrogenase / fumarate reductase iron-sulfur subunit